MSEHERIDIELGDRSYPIHIGAGVLDRADALLGPIARPGRVALLVTDANVARTEAPARLEAALERARVETRRIVIEPGEAQKSWSGLERVCEAALASGIDRTCLVIALGGGVVGDLAGFAAASLLRGLDFVQAPTSLLAQVDSSVGGKTGVNARAGKNLIGAFHQPEAVLADLDVLGELPARQRRAGYAEMVKHGLLADLAYFERLEAGAGAAALAGDHAALAETIRRSCAIKAAIVAEDERERTGKRALLNLGHTFGHAMERLSGYDDRLLHGEAVAIGMVLALEFSRRLGLIGAPEVARVERHLAEVGLPSWPTDVVEGGFETEAMIETMARDKKTVDRRLTFVLCRSLGDAFVARDAPLDVLSEVLDDARRNRSR